MSFSPDTEARMIAYLTGELDAGARQAFEDEMRREPSLKAEVEGLIAVQAMLDLDAQTAIATGDDEPPAHLFDAIMRAEQIARPAEIRQAVVKLDSTPAPSLASRFSMWLFGGGAALAVAATFMFVVLTKSNAPTAEDSMMAPEMMEAPSAAASAQKAGKKTTRDPTASVDGLGGIDTADKSAREVNIDDVIGPDDAVGQGAPAQEPMPDEGAFANGEYDGKADRSKQEKSARDDFGSDDESKRGRMGSSPTSKGNDGAALAKDGRDVASGRQDIGAASADDDDGFGQGFGKTGAAYDVREQNARPLGEAQQRATESVQKNRKSKDAYDDDSDSKLNKLSRNDIDAPGTIYGSSGGGGRGNESASGLFGKSTPADRAADEDGAESDDADSSPAKKTASKKSPARASAKESKAFADNKPKADASMKPMPVASAPVDQPTTSSSMEERSAGAVAPSAPEAEREPPPAPAAKAKRPSASSTSSRPPALSKEEGELLRGLRGSKLDEKKRRKESPNQRLIEEAEEARENLDADLLLATANHELAIGKNDEALSLYLRVQQSDPNGKLLGVLPVVGQMRALIALNRPNEAYRLLPKVKRAPAKAAGVSEGYFEAGRAAMLLGKYAEAERLLRIAVKNPSTKTRAEAALADVARAKRNAKNAPASESASESQNASEKAKSAPAESAATDDE